MWSVLPVHRRNLLALGIVLASAGMPFGPAQAQGKLTANYTITIARIPIGKIAWTVDIGESSYTTTGSGEASGLLSILASGKGTASARGIVEGGKLSPTSFTSDITRDDDKTVLQMTLDRGMATEVTGQAREASDARVPLGDAHRRDIVDPVTAFLVPTEAGDGVTRTACERTLPIFDGHRRFNLKLAFKRMDKVTVDKRDAVPAVVCTVTFEAVAGHRADSKLVKFLSQDRDIELWLTPVAGAGVLAPFRLSITHLLGNLVVQASEFQASAPVPRHPAIATDARAD
jgi:uncharacterized protein DUF3108